MPKLNFLSLARNVAGQMLFEQKMVDKMTRAKGPMGHRFIDGQAADRDSKEEYDQDDNNPL
jgi:hypothetical protein